MGYITSGPLSLSSPLCCLSKTGVTFPMSQMRKLRLRGAEATCSASKSQERVNLYLPGHRTQVDTCTPITHNSPRFRPLSHSFPSLQGSRQDSQPLGVGGRPVIEIQGPGGRAELSGVGEGKNRRWRQRAQVGWKLGIPGRCAGRGSGERISLHLLAFAPLLFPGNPTSLKTSCPIPRAQNHLGPTQTSGKLRVQGLQFLRF